MSRPPAPHPILRWALLRADGGTPPAQRFPWVLGGTWKTAAAGWRAIRARAPIHAARLLRATAVGMAGLFTLGYVVIAALRLHHPFELEWIEGGSLAMVHRLLAHEPLYDAPSLEYVAFNYPPLYYWVSSLAAHIVGEGFAALRWVSFLSSLACGALVYRVIAVETRGRLAAILGTGLFYATFRLAGAWFDIGRVDSLQLALVLAVVAVLQTRRSAFAAPLLAGVLVGLAFLAKQSAVVAVLPMGAYLAFADRRRGLLFGGAAALSIVAAAIALDARSGGWFSYFVFGLAGRYPIDVQMATRFWTIDFFRPLAVCLLGGLLSLLAPPEWTARGRGLTFAAIAGLLLASWVVRSYPATYDNVLMPACAAAALSLGLGWDAAMGHVARLGRPGGARLAVFVGLAVVLQFVSLIYDPLRQLPAPGDVDAGQRLVENIARLDGDVLLPCHDYLVIRAGKKSHFHEMSFMAVAKSGDDSTATRLRRQLREALRDRHWAWIILDTRDWLYDEVADTYAPRFDALPGEAVFWPATGMRRRPEAVFAPKADSLVAHGL